MIRFVLLLGSFALTSFAHAQALPVVRGEEALRVNDALSDAGAEDLCASGERCHTVVTDLTCKAARGDDEVKCVAVAKKKDGALVPGDIEGDHARDLFRIMRQRGFLFTNGVVGVIDAHAVDCVHPDDAVLDAAAIACTLVPNAG